MVTFSAIGTSVASFGIAVVLAIIGGCDNGPAGIDVVVVNRSKHELRDVSIQLESQKREVPTLKAGTQERVHLTHQPVGEASFAVSGRVAGGATFTSRGGYADHSTTSQHVEFNDSSDANGVTVTIRY